MSPRCLYHDAFSVTLSTDDAIYYNVIHYHGNAIHQDTVALMTLPDESIMTPSPYQITCCLYHDTFIMI